MDPTYPPLTPRPNDCHSTPLTALQLQLWTSIVNGSTKLSSKLVVTSVRISGSMDVSLLRDCLDFLVRRHEPLRTKIVLSGDLPLQQIDAPAGCCFELIDLSTRAGGDMEEQATRLVHEFVNTITDIYNGPLFEAKLLKLSDQEHVLFIVLDHMVSDGASCQILNRELWTLYQQAADGVPLSLPPLAIQFADFALWQHRTYDAWMDNHAPYWRERLAGARPISLPSDSGLENARHSSAKAHFPLGKKVAAELRGIAERENSRLPVVMLAIFAFVMSRWLNQRDLLVAFISHGRHPPELKSMIGFLANHLILRIEVDEQENFVSLLRRVGSELRSAYRHYDYSRVLRLFPERMSELYFNWSSIDPTAVAVREHQSMNAPIAVQPYPIKTKWPVDFYPFFSESPAGIIATVVYRTDRFTKPTVDRFGQYLRLSAAACGRDPLAPMASVGSP